MYGMTYGMTYKTHDVIRPLSRDQPKPKFYLLLDPNFDEPMIANWNGGKGTMDSLLNRIDH